MSKPDLNPFCHSQLPRKLPWLSATWKLLRSHLHELSGTGKGVFQSLTTTTHHSNILVKNQLHTPVVVPKLRMPGEKSLAMKYGLYLKLQMVPLASRIP